MKKKKKVVGWNSYMHKVNFEFMTKQSTKKNIRWSRKVVETDESFFVPTKNNVGQFLSQEWILGDICRKEKVGFIV